MADDDNEVVRNFTKVLWTADQEEKFETAEARKEAFKGARVEYSKKARKLIRMMGSRGVGLVAIEPVKKEKTDKKA